MLRAPGLSSNFSRLPDKGAPLSCCLPLLYVQEESPALTQNAAPHAAAAAAATADLLSPLRSQLPPAPPLFTPSSSGGLAGKRHMLLRGASL